MPSRNNYSAYIISPDMSLKTELEDLLVHHHFDVTYVNNSQDALSQLVSEPTCDVVLLDIILDDIYGIQLAKQLRFHHPDLPIVFVSRHQDPTDIVLCFEAGADDYIVWPSPLKVVMARIIARLRQPFNDISHDPKIIYANEIDIDRHQDIEFGCWHYQPKKGRFFINEKEVYLTEKENRLLKLFLRNPYQKVTRQTLAEALNLDHKPDIARDVNIHIHRLKNKLVQNSDHYPPIKSVRGIGYMLDAYLTYHYDGYELKSNRR